MSREKKNQNASKRGTIETSSLRFARSKPQKTRKIREKISKVFENFLKKVSGKSHSAENLEQSFMLAKRFILSKNLGG